MTGTRIGDWMVTYSGRKFYPLDPRMEEIYITDIAHALSNTCRFTGHTRKFYSVAQHSVLVSTILGKQGAGRLARLRGLLHDAHEAYLNDLSRPLKRSMNPSFIAAYKRAAENIDTLIFEKYGVASLSEQAIILQWIKEADDIALYTEGRDLMKGKTKGWHDAENIRPDPKKIIPLSPKKAVKLFLNRFKELQ